MYRVAVGHPHISSINRGKKRSAVGLNSRRDSQLQRVLQSRTSSRMFSLLFLLASILMMSTSSHGAFCTYHRNANSVTCGSVTCSTASPKNVADKLPSGYYYIGTNYTHPQRRVPWFDLYRLRKNNIGFWDYHSDIPELGCRGRFGLHFGRVSQGCVTVTDLSCFTRLSNEIKRHCEPVYFIAYKCRVCIKLLKTCLWTEPVTRRRTCDLQSV